MLEIRKTTDGHFSMLVSPVERDEFIALCREAERKGCDITAVLKEALADVLKRHKDNEVF